MDTVIIGDNMMYGLDPIVDSIGLVKVALNVLNSGVGDTEEFDAIVSLAKKKYKSECEIVCGPDRIEKYEAIVNILCALLADLDEDRHNTDEDYSIYSSLLNAMETVDGILRKMKGE